VSLDVKGRKFQKKIKIGFIPSFLKRLSRVACTYLSHTPKERKTH